MVIGVVLSLMTWGASEIYDNLKENVQQNKDAMKENRESIQALIDLHLKRDE